MVGPELRAVERQSYRRGIAEGERRAKRLLNCMCSTNSHLLELVRLLDSEYPIQGVLISFDLAERIVKALRSPIRSSKLAGELKRIAERSDRELSPALGQAEEQLRAMVC